MQTSKAITWQRFGRGGKRCTKDPGRERLTWRREEAHLTPSSVFENSLLLWLYDIILEHPLLLHWSPFAVSSVPHALVVDFANPFINVPLPFSFYPVSFGELTSLSERTSLSFPLSNSFPSFPTSVPGNTLLQVQNMEAIMDSAVFHFYCLSSHQILGINNISTIWHFLYVFPSFVLVPALINSQKVTRSPDFSDRSHLAYHHHLWYSEVFLSCCFLYEESHYPLDQGLYSHTLCDSSSIMLHSRSILLL